MTHIILSLNVVKQNMRVTRRIVLPRYKSALQIWLFWRDFAKSRTCTAAILLSCPDTILHAWDTKNFDRTYKHSKFLLVYVVVKVHDESITKSISQSRDNQFTQLIFSTLLGELYFTFPLFLLYLKKASCMIISELLRVVEYSHFQPNSPECTYTAFSTGYLIKKWSKVNDWGRGAEGSIIFLNYGAYLSSGFKKFPHLSFIDQLKKKYVTSAGLNSLRRKSIRISGNFDVQFYKIGLVTLLPGMI